MYLTGSKETKLDSKGRLVLQANFRKQFADGVVKLVPVKGALYGFSLEEYVAWIEQNFPDQANISSEDAEFARQFNSLAVEVELDKAGRLAVGRVGENVLALIGISADVVVSGNGDHFEVWDKAKWDATHSIDAISPALSAMILG